MKEATPRLKTLKNCDHKILFDPVNQQASNTGLRVDCVECSKPRLVHTVKKLFRLKHLLKFSIFSFFKQMIRRLKCFFFYLKEVHILTYDI